MNQLKWPNRRNRNRRASKEGIRRARRDFSPTSVTFDTPSVIVTFGQRIVLAGIPQYATDTGKLPTAAVTTDGLTVTLTYSQPGQATRIVVPDNDPAIHNFQGGVVQSGTYLFPEP